MHSNCHTSWCCFLTHFHPCLLSVTWDGGIWTDCCHGSCALLINWSGIKWIGRGRCSPGWQRYEACHKLQWCLQFSQAERGYCVRQNWYREDGSYHFFMLKQCTATKRMYKVLASWKWPLCCEEEECCVEYRTIGLFLIWQMLQEKMFMSNSRIYRVVLIMMRGSPHNGLDFLQIRLFPFGKGFQ